MEWTLASLFMVSVLLLIFSNFKSFQASKEERKAIEMVHISVKKEILEVKDSIRNLGLQIEVISKEAGIQLSSDEIVFVLEVLDLYKRNYSFKSIAKEKQVPESEILKVLAPYRTERDGRRKVVNEN
ncbi:hypothetical protein [Robertmurraya sp.]|uniref:hypothetical protein n=1 Tax=Robertmurraya sp. TaxID=2837525 RepID=UPI00370465E8